MKRLVEFPEENFLYYEKLVEEMKSSMANRQLVEGTYTRMRQLASGFLPWKDESGEEHLIEIHHRALTQLR